eukprot:CAMPEP_0183351770 /NCGR_PEP_ID=MMETSP0164_2-20130417/26242_1 /TAXON_ID=221442 /ORGANISM="Coccolithus pelagicus ssp braarudi, Strain PLY182g" /LENGTH=237 /DNA_ID=CAMNT_0025524039 /DNA_START=36 /DNA_END=749 /DNA_ORIENTATION=-
MPLMEDAAYHLSSMPIAGSLGYLLSVEYLRKAMDKREAMVISKPIMVAYNLAQVVINLYVAYVLFVATGGRVWGMGMPDSPMVRHGVYLHYLCKYLDMIDTLLIVLRKKSEQCSFLHLWHHSTIVIVWGWVHNTFPTEYTAVYSYGAWINACVHVVMYFYYALTAMNIRPPPPLKKAVTMVQLTQFASCIVHAVSALFIDATPIQYNITQVLYHIGMLKLFLPLLLGKKSSSKTKER